MGLVILLNIENTTQKKLKIHLHSLSDLDAFMINMFNAF